MPAAPTISAVDPDDDRTLETWHAVERASILTERPDAVLTSARHRVESLRHPTAYASRTLLVARDGDRVTGVAELGLSLADNLHLADVAVCVLPAQRRQGIGRALYDELARRAVAAGRTTVIGEAHTTTTHHGSMAFARALGFTSVHVEDHLSLPLPMPPERRSRLQAATAAAASEFEILTWRDRCPDALLAEYVRMRSQMEHDVPLGQVALEPVSFDEARVRTDEEVVARGHTSIVAAARRRAGGGLCGYSALLLEHGSTIVKQDDTLVLPEARGRRLGLALKLATLDRLQRDHPERSSLHTWTAPDNLAMARTNRAFGFTAVEVLHEMQRTLDRPAPPAGAT